jgi:hypothetical protein
MSKNDRSHVRRKPISLILPGIVIGLMSQAGVSAQTVPALPAATYTLTTEHLFANYPRAIQDETNYSDGASETTTAQLTIGAGGTGATLNGGPLPVPELNVSAATYGVTLDSGPESDAHVAVEFYFEIVPVGNGTNGAPVPVIVAANGSAAISSLADEPSAVADIEVLSDVYDGVGQDVFDQTAYVGYYNSLLVDSFSVQQSVSLVAGELEECAMETTATIDGYGSYNDSAKASLDPQITIDPGFSDATNYALVFSPNLQPPPELTITQSGTGLKVSWPYFASGWTLEQNPDLTTTNWTPSGNISNDGTNNFCTIASPVGNLFFRLTQ